eukprot:11704829-Ditylum_brightwellii.AAC.1
MQPSSVSADVPATVDRKVLLVTVQLAKCTGSAATADAPATINKIVLLSFVRIHPTACTELDFNVAVTTMVSSSVSTDASATISEGYNAVMSNLEELCPVFK